MAYPSQAAFPAAVSCDQILVAEAAIRVGEKSVGPLAFAHAAQIEAPRAFRNVGVQVLRRDEVVDADDLALQERPEAFDAVGMERAADILASAVANHTVMKVRLRWR